MKKVTTLLIAIVCATVMMAQGTGNSLTKRHEINAGVGLLSHTQVATFLVDMVGTVLTLGYGMAPDNYHILTPNLSYRYWFANWYALGLGFAYDVNSVKVKKLDTGEYMKRYTRSYSTFILENTFGYVRKPKFQLYGQFGLGSTFMSISGSNDYGIERVPFFNLQVTPLAMRFGGDYAGFVEFGYGYKGIINVGFSARL